MLYSPCGNSSSDSQIRYRAFGEKGAEKELEWTSRRDDPGWMVRKLTLRVYKGHVHDYHSYSNASNYKVGE